MARIDQGEIARLRTIPLTAVLEQFGAEPDPADPRYQFKTAAGRLSIDRRGGDRFYCHDIEKGGGGAIDLAQALMTGQLDRSDKQAFKNAVRALGGRFDEQAIVHAHAKQKQDAERAPAEPPKLSKDPRHVDKVRDYLTQNRMIPQNWVNRLIQTGRVFPGVTEKGFVNACFALDNGSIEQRGLGDKPFHGVAGGDKGFFTLEIGKPTKNVYVESSIDAISYAYLAHQRGEKDFAVVSITGGLKERLQDHVKSALDAGREVVSAFDSDNAGDQYHARVAEVAPGARREKPEIGKDWNDQLKVVRTMQKHPEVKQAVEAEIDRRTREIGRGR